MHGDKTTYKCTICPSQFTNKSSFDKHVEEHLQPAQFKCASCPKSFHQEYQLKRHRQSSHSGIVYHCPFCQMVGRHRHSMRRHFERQHSVLRQDWDKPGFVSQLAEKAAPAPVERQTEQQPDKFVQVSYEDMNKKDFGDTDNTQGMDTLFLRKFFINNNKTERFSDRAMLLSVGGMDESGFLQTPQADNIADLNSGEVNCNSLNGRSIFEALELKSDSIILLIAFRA